jgi:hypothetical protein
VVILNGEALRSRDYHWTKAETSRTSPAQIIGELVRKKLAAASAYTDTPLHSYRCGQPETPGALALAPERSVHTPGFEVCALDAPYPGAEFNVSASYGEGGDHSAVVEDQRKDKMLVRVVVVSFARSDFIRKADGGPDEHAEPADSSGPAAQIKAGIKIRAHKTKGVKGAVVLCFF